MFGEDGEKKEKKKKRGEENNEMEKNGKQTVKGSKWRMKRCSRPAVDS